MANYKNDDRREAHYTVKELIDGMFEMLQNYKEPITEFLENSVVVETDLLNINKDLILYNKDGSKRYGRLIDRLKEKDNIVYKIYKLIYNNEVIYVGKTKLKYLSSRKAGKYPKIPIDIKKESIIELIEETDDITREEYWRKYYEDLGCILYNERKGDTGLETLEYLKKWNDNNKDKIRVYSKKYRDNNKEKIKDINKSYYQRNKEQIKEYQRNKEQIKEYKKEYYQKNKEYIKEKSLLNYHKNKFKNKD